MPQMQTRQLGTIKSIDHGTRMETHNQGYDKELPCDHPN